MGVRGGLGLLGVVGALLFAAPAQGAVTIGSDLDVTTFESKSCGLLLCTASYNSDNVGLAHPSASPFDGVIVRWRFAQGDNATADQFALRVLRPEKTPPPWAEWAGVSTDVPVTVPAAAGTYSFETSLRVAAGDGIGLDFPAGHGNILRLAPPEAPFQRTNYWFGGLANGGAFTTRTEQWADQLLLNADIEPDADADGLGDETQDRCLTSTDPNAVCTPSGTTDPPGTTNCKKAKRKKKKSNSRSAEAAKKHKKKKKCKKRRKKGKH